MERKGKVNWTWIVMIACLMRFDRLMSNVFVNDLKWSAIRSTIGIRKERNQRVKWAGCREMEKKKMERERVKRERNKERSIQKGIWASSSLVWQKKREGMDKWMDGWLVGWSVGRLSALHLGQSKSTIPSRKVVESSIFEMVANWCKCNEVAIFQVESKRRWRKPKQNTKSANKKCEWVKCCSLFFCLPKEEEEEKDEDDDREAKKNDEWNGHQLQSV